MKLYKQSIGDAKVSRRLRLGDALWSLLGGIIGGVAVGAYTIHRYMAKPVAGLPPQQDPK